MKRTETPGAANSQPSGPSPQEPKAFNAVITKTVGCRYLLYLPEGYGKDERKWPLLLFLHGSGERGSDLNLVRRHGPPKLVDAGRALPFIVVSPQCPSSEQEWPTDMLNALLDTLLQHYAVDPHRVYLTGLSMGGYGTWKLAMEHPERFAAIVPICGGGDPLSVCALKSVPVWAFHGAKDKVVPVEKQRELVEALETCGGQVQFTVYRNATHNSWSRTYDNPDVYAWLLEHTKGSAPASSP